MKKPDRIDQLLSSHSTSVYYELKTSSGIRSHMIHCAEILPDTGILPIHILHSDTPKKRHQSEPFSFFVNDSNP